MFESPWAAVPAAALGMRRRGAGYIDGSESRLSFPRTADIKIHLPIVVVVARNYATNEQFVDIARDRTGIDYVADQSQSSSSGRRNRRNLL